MLWAGSLSLGLLLSMRDTRSIAQGSHFAPKLSTPNHVTVSSVVLRDHTVTTRNIMAGDRKWIVGSASSAYVCARAPRT
jgi:hypothetical protein